MSEEIVGENRITAIEYRLNKYRGGPCKNCGGTLRYTRSCACVACVRQTAHDQREHIKKIFSTPSALVAAQSANKELIVAE